MMQKYFLFLIFVCGTLYFAACTSESYNIDNANASDTIIVNKNDTVNSAEVQKLLKTKRVYTVKSAPTFVLSLSGNFNMGISELDVVDNPLQLLGGQNFGVRNGWGFNAIGKIPLDKQKGNLRVIIHGSYNHFQGSFNNDLYANGVVKYNLISFGGGFENNFTPKFSVKPFIGAALLGSLISGSSTYDTSGVPFNYKITNSFRLGFTLYAGIEYALSNSFGINLGARFTNVNTWLKQTQGDPNSTEISLRDAYTSNPLPFGGWKNFAYTSFYIGTSFNFGVKDRLFKF